MFRDANGFKAHYEDFSILIGADFDEWRIFVNGPAGLIHGGRQLSEAKAKECARRIVQEAQKTPEMSADLVWVPLAPGEWRNWKP